MKDQSDIELLEEMMELQLSDNDKKSQRNQSILGVMKNFIDTVNDMDETVLIPSRLMDMHPDSTTPMVAGVGEDQQTMPLVPSKSPEQQPNLHAYYSMLKAVKTELVRGPSSDDEEDEGLFTDSGSEDGTTENSSYSKSEHKLQQATAKAFREHLHGLFTVLEQLTDVSKTLTSKYQEELGDNQSCIRPKAFSM